ncbi:MAG: PilZ domain-containing protein [Acidobacteria bacterium]|nr:PilZ domain-containing protein [Acidobacteriota bacterium]
MPNLIRYLLGRFRGTVGNRRRAPRYDARRSFSVSIVDEGAGREDTRPPQTLVGRTRNLSETGFGLVVPSLRLGTNKLNDVNCTLRLMLDLPTGTAEIHVVPVRSLQLGEEDPDSGYLIGVKIKDLSDDARARLTKFLRSLRSPH